MTRRRVKRKQDVDDKKEGVGDKDDDSSDDAEEESDRPEESEDDREDDREDDSDNEASSQEECEANGGTWSEERQLCY